jgi:ABC-type branched-subunit amino acid transport system substrate-binding protein
MAYTNAFTEKLSHRHFFSTITSDRVFAHAITENLAKHSASRYCTIGNDFVYGRSITAAVMGRLKQLKPSAQVISGCEFWVPPGHLDFTPQITAILGQKPDALMFGGVVGISSDAFVKQAKAFGVFDKTLGVHPSLGMPTNNLGLQKGDLPVGILTGSDYPYPPVDTPLNQAFFKAYKERWNERPYEVSANSYTAVRLIAKTIEKAGKVDREAFADAMPGMSITHPTMGDISIRTIDHQSTSGWWLGTMVWDEKNNVVGLRDLKYMPGSTYLPTEEELRKIRGQ